MTKSAPLNPQITDRLLDLLSTDDAYRARFQGDPRSALEEIGYQSPTSTQVMDLGFASSEPEPLIDCRVGSLASKEAIAAARSDIKAMLTSGLSQISPNLDSATTAARRTLK